MTTKATTKAAAAADAAPALEELRARAATAAAAARAAIEELRGPIRRLQQDLARGRHGVCSRAEGEARARWLVEDLAKRPGFGVGELLAEDDASPAVPINAAARHLSARPAVELLAAMMPDALLAWMMNELDQLAARAGGWAELDFKGRVAAREAMAAELLDLERREEELIVALEASGVSLPRRPDADPRAVLGLRE